MVNQNGGSIDIEHISFNDKKTYKLFSKGDTTGVFQFESSGMKDYLRKLQPECVEDLIAMNALYRPGPLGKNMVDDFIQRKHGQKEIVYMHPMLEPILKETYGVIVYQEQVMRTAGNLGGFTLAQADDLRKAMGKKKLDLMREYKEIFIEGAQKNDIPRETADEIYEHIAAFAGYGFNKSHSASYALVAYQTAYLKVHHPAEFMAASLSSEMMHPDRIVILLEECRQMGLNVLPPDILKSDLKFTVNEKGIQFGLGAVKNVGHAAIDSLLQEREQYKTAGNFYEFCEHIDTRTINKKVLESLIMAGALDALEGTRAQKFEVIEIALNYAQSAQREREKGQTNLFNIDGDEEQQLMQEYPPLPVVEEWTRYEMLAKEKEMLGFYISGHPLNKYKDEVEGLSTKKIEDINELNENAATRNGGIITAVKVIQTKKDASKEMAFITLEDFSDSIEVVVFPDVYSQFKSMIKMDKMVFVIGRISRKEEDNTKILAEEIIRIEETRDKFTKNVLICMTAQGLEKTAIDSINNIVSKSPGKCALYIDVKTILNETVRMKSSKYMINPDTKTIKSLRKLLGQDSVKIA
jgi:DNA polymerase-3 subunit alpha